jgi:hypothetical protein
MFLFNVRVHSMLPSEIGTYCWDTLPVMPGDEKDPHIIIHKLAMAGNTVMVKERGIPYIAASSPLQS